MVLVTCSTRTARHGNVWLSAERSAWHFDFQSSSKTWVASKTGEELWATLTRLLAAKLGEQVTLR